MTEHTGSFQALTEQLLQQASRILALDSNDAALGDELVAYTILFDSWNQALSNVEPSQIESDQLRHVESIHQRVIDQAGAARTQLQSDLKGLKKKGRGIRAYVDTLPSKIQTMRTTKG